MVMVACAFGAAAAQTATAQSFIEISTEFEDQPVGADCGGEPCPPVDCTDQMGLAVCSVFAVFDGEFPDVQLLNVEAADIGTDGQFFQHPLGADTAPECASIQLFPHVQCDSFVTVGRTNTCSGDETATTPDFAFSGDAVTGGWVNLDPANDQGHPRPSDEPGVYRVLIARLAMAAAPCTVAGEIEVSWQAPVGGPVQTSSGQFECVAVTTPCTDNPNVCGDSNACTVDSCNPGHADAGCGGCINLTMDLNEDGRIDMADLAELLGQWGPYEPCPPHARADFDLNCFIGAPELALLLSGWGTCG